MRPRKGAKRGGGGANDETSSREAGPANLAWSPDPVTRGAALGRADALLLRIRDVRSLLKEPSTGWHDVLGACEVARKLSESFFEYVERVRPWMYFVACVERASGTTRPMDLPTSIPSALTAARARFRAEYPALESKLSDPRLLAVLRKFKDHGGARAALRLDVRGRNGTWTAVRRAISEFDAHVGSEALLRRYWISGLDP